ncbi:S8 family peptidase [Anaerosacchariphilus polymeriproducens]|uniref:Peptidase S8/S53 domain-containing protein n=1 Tax=Anaerosacchariphilus polymeriproducens TaxID=1812858 RepID=A0A371AQR0_9FIRM|nr:S8 family peptidase [Anaerosacchariphilus polymeriproducens]RDU21911.1 hypothetical protein DWV06_18190 [Anaerosacchariphilus polymeriproducens]
MPERPVILLPEPVKASRDSKSPFNIRLNKPSFERQYNRLQPKFSILKDAFNKKSISIQDSPIGVNPEFAVVFEVMGTVDSFYTAVKNVEGLEWIFDKDFLNVEPDEDFYVIEQGERVEKDITGKVYCVMSNQEAMNQLLSCWKRYNDGESDVFARGYTGLRDIFTNIKNVRAWNEKDRIEETNIIDYWKEELEIVGSRAVPFEIELFYRNEEQKRNNASNYIRSEIELLNGKVLQECIISSITYHALLVELPPNVIQLLVEKYEQIKLVHIDDIMYFRPVCQSIFESASDAEEYVESIDEMGEHVIDSEPIVALFDGMPIQNHPLLKNRIIVDDPDDLEVGYESKNRHHGTAMASLILNGDLNKPDFVQQRIYVRPILKPKEVGPSNYQEIVPENWLIVDKIHTAVVSLYERDGDTEPKAPSIKVINLSLGDPARQLATVMSPLARLLDYLAYKYSVLFIVSAGNHDEVINFIDVSYSELKEMNEEEREKYFYSLIVENQRNFKVYSPAENLNGLTIGALYDDYCEMPENDRMICAVTKGYPSPISAFGKGYRSIITPDLFYRGGRKYIYKNAYGRNAWLLSNREPGCKVASPFETGQYGQAYTFGTSDATALISHEALRCYEVLNDIYISETGTMIGREFIPILLKGMLTHGASWDGIADRFSSIVGGSEKKLARWLGNGVPDIKRVEECTKNRVTLIGTGRLKREEGHIYTLPLPVDISSKIIKRKLTVTLAYFSPVEVTRQGYRGIQMWFDVLNREQLTPDRENSEWQAVRKGTLQHEIFEGERPIVWGDDKEIQIKVNCKEDAGKCSESIPYCIFVTFEVAEGTDVDVYSKVVEKVKPMMHA